MPPVTLDDLTDADWWACDFGKECDECGYAVTSGLVSPRGRLVGFYCPRCGTLWAETDRDASDLRRWCTAQKQRRLEQAATSPVRRYP